MSYIDDVVILHDIMNYVVINNCGGGLCFCLLAYTESFDMLFYVSNGTHTLSYLNVLF